MLIKETGSLRSLMEVRSVRLALHLCFQARLSRAPVRAPVRPKPNRKNKVPVIINGFNEKFKSWRKLMGELRQYYPSLKISRIKELTEGDFVAISDSL